MNPICRRPRRYDRTRPRGAVYVAVLATAALASVMILAGLTALTAGERVRRTTEASARARHLASGALQRALTNPRNNAAWRDELSKGVSLGTSAFGGDQTTVTVTGPGGADVRASLSDPIIVIATAKAGAANHTLRATLTPRAFPLPALAAGLVGNLGVAFDSAKVDAMLPVYSNATMVATVSLIDTPVQSIGSRSGGTYNQGTSALASPVELPTFAKAAEHYLQVGTVVPWASLGGSNLDRRVIGPSHPPGGVTGNTQGVYVIDCQGNNLTLRRSRLSGTLVLRNVGLLTVSNTVLLEPAVEGFPVLIVEGSIDINLDGSALSESGQGTNYNPVGMPYLNSTDADTTDTYLANIAGIVYASGNLSIRGSVSLRGWALARGYLGVGVLGDSVAALISDVLGGNLLGLGGVLGGTPTYTNALTHRADRPSQPPPGFRQSPEFEIRDAHVVQVVE
ncbi:MAG: hypothetical protein HRU70_01145 [Phycisphaeraceae bacterium]|nr:MAG: hypothetical protein HRU70_01145 [Phycisphaeraceae bacterium]